MTPKPVGKLDKATLIVLIALALPVAWFALMLAPLMTEDVNLAGILNGLNAAMAQPFRIQWVEASPKYLFLFVGLYATCAAEPVRRRSTALRSGATSGRSQRSTHRRSPSPTC